MAAHDWNNLAPLRVAVLCGGRSSEREISLASGNAVARALAGAGHAVTQIDPAQVDLAGYDWAQTQVVFIALHGQFGEDGQVQQILEDAHVPYTGSGVQASRLALSKSAAKERFFQHRVPTASYVLIHETDSAQRICQMARLLGFPLVVKPDRQGSSLGVSLVASAEELPAALSNCFHYDPHGLLEPLIAGQEWTVGLVDATPLPPIRVKTNRPFFDYQAKYHDDGTRFEFDSGESSGIAARVVETACNACRAIGTRGLARVDLIVDKNDRPTVLEVNTVPGLTDHSLVPKAAARAGMSFTELCQRCLASALASQVETRAA
jgi:D-alanine-D-alanine ligase